MIWVFCFLPIRTPPSSFAFLFSSTIFPGIHQRYFFTRPRRIDKSVSPELLTVLPLLHTPRSYVLIWVKLPFRMSMHTSVRPLPCLR
jgi:hypothetical protein